MQEHIDFYSGLYQKNPSQCSNNSLATFLKNVNVSVPDLMEEQKEKCEKKLTIGECFNTLKHWAMTASQ